jgi:phospholipase C
MVQIDRRHLLQGAAASAALTALGVGPAALAQQQAPSKLTDIDHIIILMKENRSFDHYFGSLRGVRGFDDAAHTLFHGRSVFHQPDARHADGFVLPFHLDTMKTNAQSFVDLSHDWTPLHEAWNGGKNDNWIPALIKEDANSAQMTMGYHTRGDLPYYYALADAFTICDGYFASMMGPTGPNRDFAQTGSNDPNGRAGGPAIVNGRRSCTWETYAERLQRAGVSWCVYQTTDSFFNAHRNFVQYQTAPTTSPLYEFGFKTRSFEQLLSDLRTGNLPQVTWICPHGGTSEHPSGWPAAGEDHTRQVLEALWTNQAVWARSALILNYDENDGQFDHVVPPTPEPGTPDEWIGGMPNGLGFRVPCTIISPFSRGGYVCSQTFDHTSALKLVETRWGVEVAQLSKWRRETVGDFTRAFGFGEPPDLSLPELPETAQALKIVEKNVDTLPDPVVPATQTMPKQEPGTRPRRA